jgi:hypothetical protein
MSVRLTLAAIEELARFVVVTEAESEVAGAVKVGLRLLDAVFEGDFEAFSSQDPEKPHSLNEVAIAAGRSRTALANRIRVARLYPAYDEPFRDQVSFSHHVALLRAPEIERNQLLRQAAIQGLTVRELDRLIDQMVGPEPKPEPVARPTGLARVVADGDKLIAAAERAAGDPAQNAAMSRLIEDAEAVIRRMRKALKRKAAPNNQKRKR